MTVQPSTPYTDPEPSDSIPTTTFPTKYDRISQQQLYGLVVIITFSPMRCRTLRCISWSCSGEIWLWSLHLDELFIVVYACVFLLVHISINWIDSKQHCYVHRFRRSAVVSLTTLILLTQYGTTSHEYVWRLSLLGLYCIYDVMLVIADAVLSNVVIGLRRGNTRNRNLWSSLSMMHIV